MLDFINPSHPSEFAVLRVVAEAQEEGAMFPTSAGLCKTLQAGDMEGWQKGWLALAESIEAKTKRELALHHSAPPCDFSFTPTNTTACRTCSSPAMSSSAETRVFSSARKISTPRQSCVRWRTRMAGTISASASRAPSGCSTRSAKDKTLMSYDDPKVGGTIHYSHDYWAHNVPFMLDWLEERL
jgi:hypothetical protein